MASTSALLIASEYDIEFLRETLGKIVRRSENGELGTSKVLDMKRIAQEALEDRSWNPYGMDDDD